MSSKKVTKSDEIKPYECVRCGFKTDTANRMQIHIDRKTKCKVSDIGLDIDITKYKNQIINHTFESMMRCIFCNEFFDDKDLFIEHKIKCDKETIKKIPSTMRMILNKQLVNLKLIAAYASNRHKVLCF